MTEDDARAWVAERYPAQKVDLLDRFADLLIVESDQQNLIAPSTIPSLWSRHILDSAQLLLHAPTDWVHWIDIGAGAGLPGIVVAILADRAVTLIEPRRLRVDFLNHCIDTLSLNATIVIAARAETADVARRADVVSARAVAKLDALLRASRGFADGETFYIFPKGESAQSEVAVARRSWQGVFHVEQSIVDPKSGIVIARGVAPR